MSDQPKPTCQRCPFRYSYPFDGSSVYCVHDTATLVPTADDRTCASHPDMPAWLDARAAESRPKVGLAAQSDTPSRHEPDPERDDEECPPTPPPVPWPDHYRAIMGERERALTAEAERDRFRAAQETDGNEMIRLSGVIGRFRTVQIRAEAAVKRLDEAMRPTSSLSYPRDELAAVARDLLKIKTEK